MSAKIVVLGGGGQVGSALLSLLGEDGITFPLESVDFMKPDFTEALERLTSGMKLKAVINAAAYTQVDKAEGEGRQASRRINAEAVGELAQWCQSKGLPLVHYSTDYVFNGKGNDPHKTSEATAPLNAYGTDKREGEELMVKAGGNYLIFRTSWVYDAYAHNFFNTMLRLMSQKESLNVVDDQIGAPTYAPHLAKATLEALDNALKQPSFPSGIYHLCNGGETSWCGFAQAIFTLARTQNSAIICKEVKPISTSGYPTPAVRPLNSRLDCSDADVRLGVRMPHWEEGLKHCFNEKYESKRLQDSGSQNSTTQCAGG